MFSVTAQAHENETMSNSSTSQLKPGNRRYHTSLRCAIPPSPSRPIGRIALAQKVSKYYLRLPGILNDPVCCIMLLAIKWSLFQRMWQWRLQRILPMLLNGPDKTQKLPFPMGICIPSNLQFLGSTRVFIQNGISIGSAVFAQHGV